MTEGSGGTLTDIGPYQRDGTLTNMTPDSDWVAYTYGHALDFDGSNDYVEVSSFPNTFPATLHIHFRVHATSQYYGIFAHPDTATNGGNSGWRLGTDSASNSLYIVFGGVAAYSYSLSLTANRWYNAVVTLPGNGGTSTAYTVDELGNFSTKTLTLGTISGTPNRVRMGVRGDTSDPFNGRIGYARLWNRVLSQDEAMLLLALPFHGIYDADDDFVYKAAASGPDPAAAGFRMLLGVGR